MSVNAVPEKKCPTDNPAILDVAQFKPAAVEQEENTVKFGPTNVEGEVFLFSNINELDAFFMQTCNDAIEAEIKQFWDYTDGYAAMLKYSWPRSNANGTYGICLTSITTPFKNQSCWGFTQSSNEVVLPIRSYYNYNGVVSETLDLSA